MAQLVISRRIQSTYDNHSTAEVDYCSSYNQAEIGDTANCCSYCRYALIAINGVKITRDAIPTTMPIFAYVCSPNAIKSWNKVVKL